VQSSSAIRADRGGRPVGARFQIIRCAGFRRFAGGYGAGLYPESAQGVQRQSVEGEPGARHRPEDPVSQAQEIRTERLREEIKRTDNLPEAPDESRFSDGIGTGDTARLTKNLA